MALRGEVVDLVGLGLLDHARQRGGVREIAVMQEEPRAGRVWIAIQMVDAVGLEERRTAPDAVNDIALLQQEFCEVRAVLAGYARDECDFR